MSRAGKVYRYEATARELGYKSASTIYRMVEEGLLERIILLRRDPRITGESIDRYIAEQRRKTSSFKD